MKMTKEQKEKQIAEIKETLKDHEFKQLAAWGDGGSEVWECSRPGDSTYAFTIAVTRMGISVVGDIDGLLFNVGSNYGLPFLAGDDIDYYIHSKLESDCKNRELDRDRLIWVVTQEVMEHLFAKLDDEDIEIIERVLGNKLPEMASDSHEAAEMPNDCKELVKLLCAKHSEIDRIYAEELDVCPDWIRNEDVRQCLELIEEVEGVGALNEAYELLNGFDLFQFDMCDLSIEKPSENLMFRLYMVNAAAKRIMEIKERETVTA
jgi:hypothetical protein